MPPGSGFDARKPRIALTTALEVKDRRSRVLQGLEYLPILYYFGGSLLYIQHSIPQNLLLIIKAPTLLGFLERFEPNIDSVSYATCYLSYTT